MSSEKVAENSGSATENLSSNYSAKQKDAHEIKYVLEVHHLQKNFSQAFVSETGYLKKKLRAAALRRCIEQEQAEFGWWIEHILATVNIASL